jgi:hypothetical protein
MRVDPWPSEAFGADIENKHFNKENLTVLIPSKCLIFLVDFAIEEFLLRNLG